MALKIIKNYEENPGFWHVKLIGDVDIETSADLKETFANALDEQLAEIKIDCEDLNYIDSTGLGVMISALKRIKGEDLNITIYNAKSNILRLFKITGLDKIFILS